MRLSKSVILASLVLPATAFSYDDFPLQLSLAGVYGDVKVSVAEHGSSVGGRHREALDAFRRSLPGATDVKVTLFRLTSPEGKPFWFDGRTSSMGATSERRLLERYEQALGRGESCSGFNEHPSLVGLAFQSANGPQLITGVTNLSRLVESLLENPREGSIDRPAWSMGCTLDAFSYQTFTLFFVDPTPYSGPESEGFAILIERTSQE